MSKVNVIMEENIKHSQLGLCDSNNKKKKQPLLEISSQSPIINHLGKDTP